ncbi:MAG: hypothetical protein P9L99_08135 [Candidatus Lernaella stagnicola]|nr:hypothetical protein [Candidatus Lernaella stagnicola]
MQTRFWPFILTLSVLLFSVVTGAAADSYFTVGQEDGRWWLFDPDGERFFSTGINALSPNGHYCPVTGTYPYHDSIIALYGSEDAWADVVRSRLADWNFNTLGAWCTEGIFPEIPFAPVLYVSGADWLTGYVPDYWSQEFYDHVDESTQSCLNEAENPLLIGYFLDNEMRWGPDWRRLADLFADYIELPARAPGKEVLQQWLRYRYEGDIHFFNEVYGFSLDSWNDLQDVKHHTNLPENERQKIDREAWTAYVADHFFDVVTDAVRSKDPNHLILGARFVSWLAPRVVVEASVPYIDVMSVNHYEVYDWIAWATYLLAPSFGMVPTREMLAEYYDLAELPILISEFSFRGLDAPPPSTWPPNWLFKTADTQTERTQFTEAYVRQCIESEYCVGYHWFDWVDEPVLGRFDGENSNFGLVAEDDSVYEELTDMFTEMNLLAYQWTPVK